MDTKLDIMAFPLAAALTMGILYIICTIFVALWPVFSFKVFGWLLHLTNVALFTTELRVTWAGFMVGLVQAVVYSYVVALLFALLYNKMAKSADR